MSKLSKREKVLLCIIAISIVSYVYFKFFILKTVDSITLSRENIRKYEEQLDTQRKISTKNEGLKKELEDLKQKNENYVKALPKNERNPEIAYILKSLGDRSKIVLESINLGQPSKSDNGQQSNTNKSTTEKKDTLKEGFLTAPVNVNVTGDYSTIIEFIRLIENDSRIAEVSRVTMSTNSTPANIVQASIDVVYYYTSSGAEVYYDFNNGIYGKEDLFK